MGKLHQEIFERLHLEETSNMKAALLVEFKKPYLIKEVPMPDILDSRDVLIRVTAASWCFTDAEVARGMPVHGGCKLPIIPGHEAVGIVEKLGKDAETRFKLGMRVGTLNHYHVCGRCVECRSASDGYIFCQTDVKTLGITMDGGLAEYLVSDSAHVFPLPEELSDLDAAPLMCAGTTIHKAIERCQLPKGSWIGIIGAGGGLGHLGCQFAKGLGYNVVGVDAEDAALKLIRKQSCSDLVIDARSATPDALRQLVVKTTDRDRISEPGIELSGGCHAVIILAVSQSAFTLAFKLARKHGMLVQVSVPEKGWQVDALDLLFKDLHIRGSLYATAADAERMLADAVKFGVKVERRAFSLNRVNEAVDSAHEGGKIVVDMAL